MRKRWDRENLKKYGVALRVGSDSELIEFIESQKAAGKGTSEIFREAIEELKNKAQKEKEKTT